MFNEGSEIDVRPSAIYVTLVNQFAEEKRSVNQWVDKLCDSTSNRRKRDKKRAKLQYILTIPLMDVKIYDDNLPNVLGV